MTANALRDWCASAERAQLHRAGAPRGRTRFVESFGSRVRDEVLSAEAFDSVIEAQTVIND